MSLFASYDERQLFQLIAEDDEQAFRTIFHAYNSRLFPFVLKMTKSEAAAEEIIQDVFLKLWLNRHTLPDIELPQAWLMRVASNLAISHLRRKGVEVRALRVLVDHHPLPEDSVSYDLDARELKRIIAQAVDKLPDKRRKVYILSRQVGMNRQEIAEHMGISESTVKNQLGEALRFIQEYIQKAHGVYLPLFLLFLLK